MIWKTTLAFLVTLEKSQPLKNPRFVLSFLLVAFLAPIQSGLSQVSDPNETTACAIDVVGCPPTDIVESCGNVTFEEVLGNYVNWTEPDFSLDCGDETGYQYEISFDLPESKEDCWSFYKVQRVGTNSGTLNLWKSDGSASGTALVTSPSFYINEVIEGSMEITTNVGEKYNVNVYLIGPDGKSDILDTFLVTGNGNLETYDFSIDPAFYDNSGTYKDNAVFRIRFEYVPVTKVTNSNFVELITIDAGLFGASCAEEANFAVTKTHNPGDFFPVGTTTVTYTATCYGCSPQIQDSCSFDVIVNPTPDAPSVTTILIEECDQGQVLDANYALVNTVNVVWYDALEDGNEVSSPILSTQGTVKYYAEKVVDDCSSLTRTAVTLILNETPAKPVVISSTDTTCEQDNGSINFTVEAGLNYTLTDTSNNTYTHSSGVYSNLPAGTYSLLASTEDCDSQATEVVISATNDTQDPDISISGDRSEYTDEGECSADITLSDAIFSDNCSGVLLTWEMTGATIQSGSGQIGAFSFNKGITTIEYTVTDASNNTTSASLTVTITDDENPTISVGSAIAQNTDTDNCSANVEVPAVTFDDNCTGSTLAYILTGATTDSGNGQVGTQTFNIGTTTINYTVTDAANRTATASVTVTITDNEDPTISVGSAIAQNTDTGSCSAVVTYEVPTASDNCAGVTTTMTQGIASGEEFPLGTTTVTYTAKDVAGNEVSTTFRVTIIDNLKPIISAEANIEQTADTGLCSAEVTIVPATAADNCGVGAPTGTRNDGEALDAPYPVGTTVITWTVADNNNNNAVPVEQTVTITDNEQPTITCGGTISQPADAGESFATITVNAPVTADNCEVESVVNDYNDTADASGTYPLGTTTVTWTVTDIHGNQSTCEQTITVTDEEAPQITCAAPQNQTADADACEAFVNVTAPVVSDNDGIKSIVNDHNGTNDASGIYPVGITVVTWTVTDNNDNTSSCTQNITVTDDQAPAITCAADQTQAADADVCEAYVTVTAPTTSDNCGIASIVNDFNNTADASGTYPVGTTVVTWTVTDIHGNTNTCEQSIIVNDDQAPIADVAELPTVTGECSATVSVVPTATDTCEGSINGTTNDPLTYTEQGTYTITWSFDDGNDNISTQTQTVIVNDISAPVADLDELPTVTGECAATVAAVPTATDTCEGTINGTTNDPLTYTEQGTYTITWSFDDGNGNTSTQEQTVIINDTAAPVADVAELPTVTGGCSVNITTVPTATDTCEGTINGTTNDPLIYEEQGTFTITWTYDDGNGNSSSQNQTVVVNDTNAPVADLNDLPTITGECSVAVDTVPTATDNCSGDKFNGTTEDALTYNELGTYTITWSFDDGNGNTSTQEQTVIVNDVTAPVADLDELPTVTGECAAAVTAVPTATDTCEGTINGTTNDPLTYNEQGTYTITWTFDDGNENISTQTQTVIVNDVTAPAADVAELPTVTGECAATVSAVPTATDNCGGTINGTTSDPLTYNEQGTYTITWTFDDGNENISTKTQTVIVNDVTAPVADLAELPTVTGECSATVAAVPIATDTCEGTINGTTNDPLTYTEQGTYTVTWTFDDGNGNTSTQIQTVIVEDVTAPVADVAELPTVTGECSATVAAVPTATDNCEGTINGTSEDALTYNEQGTYTVTWTFDDGNGNTSTQTQTVIVDDVTAPVADVTELPAVTGECSATVSVVPTATDTCVGIINGTTNDSLTYNEQGTYTVTWTFDDGNGNTSTQTQTVIVDDVTASVADVAELPTVTGECSATVSVVPTATDTCVGIINGTTNDPLTYNEQGTYTVTWTFDDGNGNTSTQTQTVIVDDVTAPAADVTELPTVTGECSATVSVVPTATDTCEGTIKGTTNDPLTYNEQGTYTVTWTFDDGNGNTSTQTQTVIVDDVTAPAADVTELPTVKGECSTTVSVVPTATDTCEGTINGTTNDPLTYNEQGTYKVTWNFDDGNGNTSNQTQTVIVDDVTAPVADVAELPTVTGECSATVTAFPTATDSCEGIIEGTTNDALTYNEQGTYTVTWTFDDGNGNLSTQSQTVIVDDVTAPVIACPENISSTVEFGVSSLVVNYQSVTATDNCSETTIEQTAGLASGSGFPVGTTTNTFVVTDASGNTATCSFDIIVEELPEEKPQPPVLVEVQPTCEVPTGNITIQTVAGLTYSINGTDYQESGVFINLEPGTYSVTAQNSSGEISDVVQVTLAEPSAETIRTASKDLCIEDDPFDLFDLLIGDYDETGTWEDTNQTGALSGSFIDPELMDVGTYTFNYVLGGNCPSTTSVQVSINDLCVVLACNFDDIKNGISKVVTPGRDTFNDFFIVDQERECGFSYNLKVFNRWGNEVFRANNYQNNWDGQSNNSFTSSNQLSSGTYYYIVEIIGSGFEPIQGYIYLGTK